MLSFSMCSHMCLPRLRGTNPMSVSSPRRIHVLEPSSSKKCSFIHTRSKPPARTLDIAPSCIPCQYIVCSSASVEVAHAAQNIFLALFGCGKRSPRADEPRLLASSLRVSFRLDTPEHALAPGRSIS